MTPDDTPQTTKLVYCKTELDYFTETVYEGWSVHSVTNTDVIRTKKTRDQYGYEKLTGEHEKLSVAVVVLTRADQGLPARKEAELEEARSECYRAQLSEEKHVAEIKQLTETVKKLEEQVTRDSSVHEQNLKTIQRYQNSIQIFEKDLAKICTHFGTKAIEEALK